MNARLLLDLMAHQVYRAGARFHEARVTALDRLGRRFAATTTDGDEVTANAVIAATKNEVGYLEGLEVNDRGKSFIETDDRGRSGVEGLYAAGRLAQKPPQTAVCAGHGAEVAVTLLEDLDRPFYHDWVAPTGYFTGRDREVPAGCEEIDEAEVRRRERESMAVMQAAFEKPHPDRPEQHPSVAED